MSGFIKFDNVSKIYRSGELETAALSEVSFEIDRGEMCVIVGESGAGKTTLLNLLGGMDTVSDGNVFLENDAISLFNTKQMAKYRRYDVGFVFQFYNLIPNLTALENVEIAAQLTREPLDCRTVLGRVGLDERVNNFPSQLSGGEQQRVAIARALAKNPKLLLCDEPTGALDYATGKAVLQVLQDSCKYSGMTVIIITHNTALTAMADRVIRLKSGRLHSIKLNEHPMDVEQLEW